MPYTWVPGKPKKKRATHCSIVSQDAVILLRTTDINCTEKGTPQNMGH